MRSVGTRAAAVALLGLGALAGCADGVRVDAAHPPVLAVQAASGGVDVVPWSWCFSDPDGPGACADGAPPAEPPQLGAGPAMPFGFPLEDWSFTATSEPVGTGCVVGRTVTAVGDRYAVDLAGVTGVQDVTVVGWGEQGDLSVTVRWDTGVPGDGGC
ncbi:hypothetical protein GCM10028777_14130 [Angustibacter speluncae]